MSTYHAMPGEVVDLDTWADDLPEPHSKAILRTDTLELARLVVKAAEPMHPHRPCVVTGATVIHCLQGAIALAVEEKELRLGAGQLVYLDGGTPHTITGIEDAVLLLTIFFESNP